MTKTKFTFFLGLGLLAGWLAPSTIQAAGHPNSGVIGQVFIGPLCPICPFPGSEYRPFQTSISVYSDTGRFITRFRTDAEGQFEVTLKQGRYVLVPDGAGSLILPHVSSVQVVVQ